MRPRENKHHVLFTKYGQPVHSPSSAVKQTASLHAAADCIIFIHRQRHGGFGLLRQCDLRQVPFIYMPFIKIAAGGVFLRAVQYAARTDVIRPRQPPGAAAVRLSLRLCRSLSGAAQNT